MSEIANNIVTLETKKHKLERLCKWEHVDEVNRRLLAGESGKKLEDWCRSMGFNISHAKLYEYKNLLQEAISKRITVERILGIGVPKRKAIQLQALDPEKTREMVKSELDVLDAIIQSGFDALNKKPEVRIADAMKAIELKNKLTGGKHGALTNYGLDHLREVEQAKFQAIVNVVLTYLPEDIHEELMSSIELAEQEFYRVNAPDMYEEYMKAKQEESKDLVQAVQEDYGNEEDYDDGEDNEE